MSARALTPEQMVLISNLFRAGTINFENNRPFKHHARLPQAPISPVMFEFRTKDNPNPSQLTPSLVNDMALEMVLAFLAQGTYPVYLAGVPYAAEPHAQAMWHLFGEHVTYKPDLITLLKTEGFGGRKIEGVVESNLKQGASTLAVETVTTSGDSTLEAIEAIEKSRVRVNDVIVFLDREQGARQRIEATGRTFTAVLTLTPVMDYCLQQGYVKEPKYNEIMRYIAQNQFAT